MSQDSSSSGSQRWQPPTAAELQKMLPQYEITALIGRGGMGAVYKGRQITLDRSVAIKILSNDLENTDASFAERFKNEARSMAKLSHPGIVAVHDSGETSDGLLYIVMEFIEGTDVSRMIAQQGRLHSEHAHAITAHVCDALAYAHERGIIHRDIKPANIMISHDGVVKVADFGLAKMHMADGQSGLTQSGMAMGTLNYMAPEALTLGSAVDHRADIYAVGVMLYQMLAGKLPQGLFELPSMLVPGLDPRFDGIIARAMRDDREIRYQSTREMRADLDSIITQPVVVARIEEAKQRTETQPRSGAQTPFMTERVVVVREHASSTPWLWLAVAALVVLTALGAWWVVNSGRSSPPQIAAVAPKAESVPAAAPPFAPSSSLTPDQQKADAVWRSRWGKPGRLCMMNYGPNASPSLLDQAASFRDFVYASVNNTRWVALRSNGQIYTNVKSLPQSGRAVGVVQGTYSGPDIVIQEGGMAHVAGVLAHPHPVLQAKSSQLSMLFEDNPGFDTTVLAFQDLDGSWTLKGECFDRGRLQRPDLTSQPPIQDIRLNHHGIGVLRNDGSFRFYGGRELPVPEEVATGVRAVFAGSVLWQFHRHDGSAWQVQMGDVKLRGEFQEIADIRRLAEQTANVRDARYSVAWTDAAGKWTSSKANRPVLAHLSAIKPEIFSLSFSNDETLVWIDNDPTSTSPALTQALRFDESSKTSMAAAKPFSTTPVPAVPTAVAATNPAFTAAQQQADKVWRSRWGKPGRLRLQVEDMETSLSVDGVAQHADFVCVLAVSSGVGSRWYALRENGQLHSSKRAKPTAECFIGMVQGYDGAPEVLIRAGGIPEVDGKLLRAEPVIDARSYRIWSLLGLPRTDATANLYAFQNVDGSWSLQGAPLEQKLMEMPDLSGSPAVKDVSLSTQGVAVLREEGSMRFYGKKERIVAAGAGDGVKKFFLGGQTGFFLHNDGTLNLFNVAAQEPLSLQKLDTWRDVDELNSDLLGTYWITNKGEWMTRGGHERIISAINNLKPRHYSLGIGRSGDLLLWIEPDPAMNVVSAPPEVKTTSASPVPEQKPMSAAPPPASPATTNAVANATAPTQANAADQQKAETVWRSRWSLPGRLRLHTERVVNPASIAITDQYVDFVSVVATPPGSRSNMQGRWLALRANGDVFGSEIGVRSGQRYIGVVQGLSGGFDILIRSGGIPESQDGRVLRQQPVLQARSFRVGRGSGRENNVLAFQNVDGSWSLTGRLVDEKKLVVDLSGAPAVKDVTLAGDGIAVLRADGRLRLYGGSVTALPEAIATGVKSAGFGERYWYILGANRVLSLVRFASPEATAPEMTTQISDVDELHVKLCIGCWKTVQGAWQTNSTEKAILQKVNALKPGTAFDLALHNVHGDMLYWIETAPGAPANKPAASPATPVMPVAPQVTPVVAAAPNPSSKIDLHKADTAWRERWGKPGKLHLFAQGAAGAASIAAADAFDDFVQVAASLPHSISAPQGRWLALRKTGQLIGNVAAPVAGQRYVGMVLGQNGAPDIFIREGGVPESQGVVLRQQPVLQARSFRLSASAGPAGNLVAFQNVDGTWTVTGAPVDKKEIAPDLTGSPAVKDVSFSSLGVVVLRSDGDLRLYGRSEVRLPVAFTKGVTTASLEGQVWYALGRNRTLSFAEVRDLSNPASAAITQLTDVIEMRATNSYGFWKIRRGGWQTNAQEPLIMQTLNKADPEIFAPAFGTEGSFILWIEPK